MPRRHLKQVYLFSSLALGAYLLVHLLGSFLPVQVTPTSLYALPWLMMAMATLASSLGGVKILPLALLILAFEASRSGLGSAGWLVPVLAATLYLADRVGKSLRMAHQRLAWLLEASEEISRATQFEVLVEALPRLLAPLAPTVEVWRRDPRADLQEDLPLRRATLSYHPSPGVRLVAALGSPFALGQMALLEALDRTGGITQFVLVDEEPLYLLRLDGPRPLSPTQVRSLERLAELAGQRLTRLQGRAHTAFLQRLSELFDQADDGLGDGLEALCGFLQLERGYIYKQKGSRLFLLASCGPKAGLDGREGLLLEGLAQRVLEQKEAYFSTQGRFEEKPTQAAALLPLSTGPNRPRHLLVLFQGEARWWTEGERRLLLSVTRVLGRALHRQEMLAQRETILRLSQKAHQGEEGLYQEILQEAVGLVPGAEAGSLLLREGTVYRYKAALGYDLAALGGLELSEDDLLEWYTLGQEGWGQGRPRLLWGEALRRVLQASAQSKPELREAGRLGQIQANLTLPVVFQGQVVALLNLENLHDPTALAEDSLEAARFFAEPIGALIHGLRQRALLEAAARTDALTGLLNRRAFDQDLAQELERARRYGYPLSLLVFDLQNFKQINDTLGHAAGDQALQVVAEILKQHTRESDRPYRWGGDEFALVLPHTGASGAAALVAHLSERISAVVLNGHHLGANIGLAIFPQEANSFDALLSLADTRMYQAKALGVAWCLNSSEGF